MINKFYNWLDKTEKNWTIEKAKKCYWIIGIVFVIFFTIIFIISIQTSSPRTNTDTTDKNTRTCQVCNNKYKSTSDNGKSIRRTNMCLKCYNDYKIRQELPVN